jgi:hydrogenase maturation protease
MTTHRPRILIAGIGNIFHGDDAFGVELAQRLLRRKQAEGVKVIDFGIRGFDLAYALMDGAEVTILLDAIKRGGAPGTLYTIEIDPVLPVGETPEPTLEAHGMNPTSVLRMVKNMGGELNRILLVGCEPDTFGPEEEGMLGLSPVVMAAVDRAVGIVETLVSTILSESNSYEELVDVKN